MAFLSKSVTNKKLDCHGPVFEKQEPACSHEVLINIPTEATSYASHIKYGYLLL